MSQKAQPGWLAVILVSLVSSGAVGAAVWWHCNARIQQGPAPVAAPDSEYLAELKRQLGQAQGDERKWKKAYTETNDRERDLLSKSSSVAEGLSVRQDHAQIRREYEGLRKAAQEKADRLTLELLKTEGK